MNQLQTLIKPLKHLICLYLEEKDYFNVFRASKNLRVISKYDFDFFLLTNLLKKGNADIYNITYIYRRYDNYYNKETITNVLTFLFIERIKRNLKNNFIPISTIDELTFFTEINKEINRKNDRNKDKVDICLKFDLHINNSQIEAKILNFLSSVRCIKISKNFYFYLDIIIENNLSIDIQNSIDISNYEEFKKVEKYLNDYNNNNNCNKNLKLIFSYLEQNSNYLYNFFYCIKNTIKLLQFDFFNGTDEYIIKFFKVLDEIDFNFDFEVEIRLDYMLKYIFMNKYYNVLKHIKVLRKYFDFDSCEQMSIFKETIPYLINLYCIEIRYNSQESVFSIIDSIINLKADSRITEMSIYHIEDHNLFFSKFILNNFKNLKRFEFLDVSYKQIDSHSIRITDDGLDEFVYFERLQQILDNSMYDEIVLSNNAIIKNMQTYKRFIDNLSNPFLLTNFTDLNLRIACNDNKTSSLNFINFGIKRVSSIKGVNKTSIEILNFLKDLNCKFLNLSLEVSNIHTIYFENLFCLNVLSVENDKNYIFIKFFVENYKKFIYLSKFIYLTKLSLNQIYSFLKDLAFSKASTLIECNMTINLSDSLSSMNLENLKNIPGIKLLF